MHGQGSERAARQEIVQRALTAGAVPLAIKGVELHKDPTVAEKLAGLLGNLARGLGGKSRPDLTQGANRSF